MVFYDFAQNFYGILKIGVLKIKPHKKIWGEDKNNDC